MIEYKTRCDHTAHEYVFTYFGIEYRFSYFLSEEERQDKVSSIILEHRNKMIEDVFYKN